MRKNVSEEKEVKAGRFSIVSHENPTDSNRIASKFR